MLDSLLLDPIHPPDLLASSPAPRTPPHYRERPRVALQSGALVALTLHLSNGFPAATALDLACSLAHCHRSRVSVPVDGSLHALPGLVVTALSRAALPSDRLEIVIGCAAVQQAGIEALLALSALRDEGIGIALGGIGPNRIDLIRRLPLSAIILAPTAVRDIPASASAIAALRDLLVMATDNALRVTATGVTSESQRALLSGLGVHDGEGPLFGPNPAHPAASGRILAEA